MSKRGRRILSLVVFAVVAVVSGTIIGVIVFLGHPEAVRDLHAVATFHDDGTATVDEHILYRFPQDRHGIYRVLPDVPPSDASRIRVSSDNTNRYEVLPESGGIRLKIGDPDRTISGEHRYDITYPLRTVNAGEGHFGWNGVGAAWDVPIERAELDLVAPWRWERAACDVGATGSVGGCTVTQAEPGHLVVSYGRLDAGEGITVYADRGAELATTPEPRAVELAGTPVAWDERPLPLAGIWILGTLLVAVGVSVVMRRLGRDVVMAGPATTGSAADLAFGTTPGSALSGGVRRVDDTRLDEWAATEFTPPPGLEPWQGSVLHSEAPTNRAKVAWLLGLAVRDRVRISESEPPVLSRGRAPADPETAGLLEVAFAGRSSITLGSYDPQFTSMWTSLPSLFSGWFRASGFADPAGERRVRVARILGTLGIPGSLVTTWFLSVSTRYGPAAAGSTTVRESPVGLLAVIVGSVLFGLTLGLAARGWELHIRTPAGSAMWLRVESFRRFLAASEAEHVRQAAERGLLREYTAWAIGLDEVTHWTAAVEAAGLEPSTPGLGTALMAHSFSSSATSAGTTPSSSGGGGGGVGGGGGGGGGGSW